MILGDRGIYLILHYSLTALIEDFMVHLCLTVQVIFLG